MKITVFILVVLIFISCSLRKSNSENKRKLPKNTTYVKITPKSYIKKLPEKLNENSGIILYDNLLWTFNDSGGRNKLYALNKDGKIKKEIEIKDAKNDDWEDIAQDKKHIYIGDFGNNNGGRKNQKIYKIKKKDIRKKDKQELKSTTIKFDFSNQQTFGFLPKQTPFDCEAMVVFKESLYIFTKDWSDKTTTAYQIPTKEGEYVVKPQKKFNATGLITGADISPDKTKLVLVGYENYKSFVWLFPDILSNDLFEGRKVFIDLDKLFDAQTEGVCFKDNNTILVSCERSTSFLQQVFEIDLKTIE